MAKGLVKTCYKLFLAQKTQLSPKRADSETFKPVEHYEMFTLQPKLMESLYYMYHHTKEEQYRDMAYKIIINIEKYCLNKDGYVGLLDVNNEELGQVGVMDSKFISETLKYAYLIFDEQYYHLNLGGHLMKL